MTFEKWWNKTKMLPLAAGSIKDLSAAQVVSLLHDFSEVCWKAAQKEITGVCYDGRCKKCIEKENVIFQRGVTDGKEEMIEKIMKWHRKDKGGDDFPVCEEVYNKNVKIISDVYQFSGDEEKVIPKKQAQKEAEMEKCYFCEYLRNLEKEGEKVND